MKKTSDQPDNEDQNFYDKHADLVFFFVLIVIAPLAGIAIVEMARYLVYRILEK